MDAGGDFGRVARVGFEDCCFDAVGGFEFAGEGARGGFVVGVVDGDVGAFCGEFAGDFGTEASVFRGREMLDD